MSLWKSILKPEIRINIWINWVCGDICALFVKLRVKDDRRILKFIHTGRKLFCCVSLLLWNQTSQVDTHGCWASPWLFFICTFQNFLTFHYVAQTGTESSVNLALAYFLSPPLPHPPHPTKEQQVWVIWKTYVLAYFLSLWWGTMTKGTLREERVCFSL